MKHNLPSKFVHPDDMAQALPAILNADVNLLLLKDAGEHRNGGCAQQNAERSDTVRSLGTGAEKTKWEGLRQVHPCPTRRQMRASGDESREAYKQNQRLNAILCASQPLAGFLRPCRIQIRSPDKTGIVTKPGLAPVADQKTLQIRTGKGACPGFVRAS